MVDLFCTNARQRIKENFKAVKQNMGKACYKMSTAFMEGKFEWMLTDTYTDFPPANRPARMTDADAATQPEEPAPPIEEEQQESPPAET